MFCVPAVVMETLEAVGQHILTLFQKIERKTFRLQNKLVRQQWLMQRISLIIIRDDST